MKPVHEVTDYKTPEVEEVCLFEDDEEMACACMCMFGGSGAGAY